MNNTTTDATTDAMAAQGYFLSPEDHVFVHCLNQDYDIELDFNGEVYDLSIAANRVRFMGRPMCGLRASLVKGRNRTVIGTLQGEGDDRITTETLATFLVEAFDLWG